MKNAHKVKPRLAYFFVALASYAAAQLSPQKPSRLTLEKLHKRLGL